MAKFNLFKEEGTSIEKYWRFCQEFEGENSKDVAFQFLEIDQKAGTYFIKNWSWDPSTNILTITFIDKVKDRYGSTAKYQILEA